MSRFLWRSLSSGQHWSNLLAAGLGCAFTTLAGSVLGGTCPRFVPSPTENVSGVLAVIEVPDNTHYHIAPRAIIDWGDGASSVGTIGGGFPSVPPGGLLYNVGGSHHYSVAENGIHITVIATNPAYTCTTNNFDVGPPGPPPPGSDVLSNPTLILGRAHVNVAITGVIATFSDSNPSAVVSDFTARIDWGDGTQSQGVVSGSAGTLLVSGDGHAYGQHGHFTVSVSLSAPGVTSSTATGFVRVR